MLWSEIPVHVIDFEGDRRSGIVEYGIVTIQGGSVKNCHTRICRPRGVITPVETRLHGISLKNSKLEDPFIEEWELFSELRQEGLFAAHHASVEKRLLSDVWPYPAYSPDFIDSSRKIADWGPWIDSRKIYETIYANNIENYRLSHLVDVFELNHELMKLGALHCPVGRCKFHRALFDALACALLLIQIAQSEDTPPNLSLQWLIDASYSRVMKRQQQQGDLFD